jgi:hypothetical protein
MGMLLDFWPEELQQGALAIAVTYNHGNLTSF